MTKSIILTTVVCCGAATMASALQQSASNQELANRIQELAPDPAYIMPANLGEMVERSQAAVVAIIGGTGEILFETDKSPSGVTISRPAFGQYHVTIQEVLFNKRRTNAPALLPGPAILTQRIGRQLAVDFAAGKQPAKPNDKCLLFLWYRPGSADWSIMQWPLQFRQATEAGDRAEPVAPLPNGLTLLKQQWFGSSVATTKTATGMAPQWSTLVTEVKRLGTSAKL